MGELAMRTLTELGPWLWMVCGFALMFTEIFSGRGIGLSLALGTMIAGTIAIFGASGVLPPIPSAVQSVIFMASTLAIFVTIKPRTKPV
jgi:membrane protein implicated in regulation of membrane protease activity